MKDDIIEDIDFIKTELESLNQKVDTILDMLNNFTIMLMEDPEDEEDIYDNDDSWVPEQNEEWNSYDDDDE